MRRASRLALMVSACVACGPTPGADTDQGDAGGGASTGDAPTGSSGPPELPPPTSECGNAIVEPGEACDDGDDGCDLCAKDCTVPGDPELAWSVPLEPIVDVDHVDMTRAGRVYVLGATADGVNLLHTIEAAGVVHTVDVTALGLAHVAAFHVNGAAADGVEVGLLGELADDTLVVARLGPDGPVGEPVPIDRTKASAEMAVTSVGVTFTTVAGNFTHFWTGEVVELVALADVLFGRVDALGDRLVFMSSHGVILVDPDGGARVDLECGAASLTTSGTHAVWGGETYKWGDLAMGSCDLGSGEEISSVLASGSSGLESGPVASVLDAAPNGNPIGEWSVCPSGQGSAGGCVVPRTRGFGGPGDPEALALDACDDGGTARVGPDRSIYMVRRDRHTGALSLVRRWTLPDEPPWG